MASKKKQDVATEKREDGTETAAPSATPRVGTLLVVADGFLWQNDLPTSPGPLLPGARERLLAARDRADRVVIASFCCNTHAGAQRVRAIIERDLNLPLSASFDLHTAVGFPLFDEVVGAC